MAAVRRFLLRLVSFFRSGHAEANLAREINAHLQLLEDKFIAQGMGAEDARYAARRAFGGVEQVKEHQRDTRSFRSLDNWWLDLELGVRMLIKYPGLTVVGGLAISAAIGVGAVRFELINERLNPSLPLDEGERIVRMQNWDRAAGAPEFRSLHDFVKWSQDLRAVEDLGAYRTLKRNLITGEGPPEPVEVAEITASAFRLVRVAPLLGAH